MKFHRFLTWENTKRSLDVIQTIALVAAGVGIVYAADTFYYSELEESANIGVTFNDQISKGTNAAIINRIEDAKNPADTSILTTDDPPGPYTGDQLGNLLSEYDTLWYLHEERLIDDKLIANLFCGDLEAIYPNRFIQAYLKSVRVGGPIDQETYIGFDKSAQLCLSWDTSTYGAELAR